MYPALARATAGRKWRRQVKTFARPYEAGLSRPEIEARQLEKFNEVWGSALESSIFYREWAKRHDLPAAISSKPRFYILLTPLAPPPIQS